MHIPRMRAPSGRFLLSLRKLESHGLLYFLVTVNRRGNWARLSCCISSGLSESYDFLNVLFWYLNILDSLSSTSIDTPSSTRSNKVLSPHGCSAGMNAISPIWPRGHRVIPVLARSSSTSTSSVWAARLPSGRRWFLYPQFLGIDKFRFFRLWV